MKKKILLGLLFMVLVFGAFFVGTMFQNTSQVMDILKEESIVISINPKVMYKTSNTGKVIDVVHLNDDAKIYNPEDFIGLDIKEAANKTVEVAKEHGYVKEDTVVKVTSLDPNSVYVDDIVINLKGAKVNVKTEKLSQDVINTIMENIDEDSEMEVTVTDGDNIVINKVIKGDTGYKPKEEHVESGSKKDEVPTTEKNLGGGFVQVEQAGYGDYIKGEHVYLYEGGPRYFKFYETSKIGCKDAIDKKACANWYVNDLTPRLASVKGNLETWQNQYDVEVRRLEEAQKKVTELEDEILNYDPEDNYTPLEDLKTSLEHYKTVVEGATSGKKEAQDYIKAINLEIEEYNKVLSVYYSVLNN